MDRLQNLLSGNHSISQLGTSSPSKNLENLRIISGNSHPQLAKKVAEYLDISITPSIADKFSNSEIRIQIQENVRRKDVVIIQTGSQDTKLGYSINDFLMETFIMINACRLSSVGEIILLIPCFPYARQDKKDISRAPISGRTVADLLQTVGVTRVITLDLHASQIAGFFSIPVDNLYSVNIMAEYLKQNYLQQNYLQQKTIISESTTSSSTQDHQSDQNDYVLVSPDAGGIKRMDSLAQKVSMKSVIMHKTRDHQQKSVVKQTVLIGEKDCVKGKSCIIIDDMCDTGGTICQASKTLMEEGAKDVRLLLVHGIFSGPALERLNQYDYIKEVIVTNSLPQEENIKICPKIKVIDISPLLAEVVNRLQTGESISSLFN